MKPPSRARALAFTALAVLALSPAARADQVDQADRVDRAVQPPAPVSPERPEKPHYRIPKISTPIKIDGVLDDAAWSEALKIDVNNEFNPGRNVPAPVTTLCYLAYDEDNLYAGFRADAPDPEAIRAHLTDRDAAFRDDFVGLILDTFNDERRGYELFVNPLGVQMDLALNETAEIEEDSAWDAIWDSAGRIDEQGYVVEMAIPFTSLRFQRTEGEQTWGIGPYRAHARSLRHQIASTWMDPDDNCFVCQSPKVTGFAGVEPGRNLELDPTAIGQRTDRRSDFPDGDIENGDEEGELGLTARWGITPNLTLSGAVNPDFSQVEADAVQLDVDTQFALFFPEKRPFFLEAADFFQTPFSVIYTRTVADPRWGAKLSGKEGKNAFGFFVAEDDQTNLLLPGDQLSFTTSLQDVTTDAALRYRRDLGASSTLGAVATHREGEDYFNTVAGLDGRWRPTASDVVTVQALGSRTEYPDQSADGIVLPEGRLDGSALRAAYDHNTREWFWLARWEKVDDGFRADLGFLPQVGYELSLAGLARTWWAQDRDAWYTSVTFGGDWGQTDGENGTVLQREVDAYVRLTGPWQSTYQLEQVRRDRFWNGTTYDESSTQLIADLRPTGSLGLTLFATVGDTIDFDHDRPGDLLRLRPSVSFNFGRHLQTALDHDLQRVKVQGGELLELNVSQLRAVYQWNIRTFVRAIVQYVDQEINRDLFTAFPVPADDEHLFTQLLFSYKLNPTTVLFLGYSDNQSGGEDAEGRPIDLTRSDRTFFFKVGYALVL